MGSKVIIIGGEPGKNKEIIESLGGKGVDLVLLAEEGDDLADALKADGLASLVPGGYTGDTPKPSGHVKEFAMKLGDPSEYALGESVCDPLQDAILSTEMACELSKDGNDVTLKILQKHLMNLHALQIEQLREKPEIMLEPSIEIQPSEDQMAAIQALKDRCPSGVVRACSSRGLT